MQAAFNGHLDVVNVLLETPGLLVDLQDAVSNIAICNSHARNKLAFSNMFFVFVFFACFSIVR